MIGALRVNINQKRLTVLLDIENTRWVSFDIKFTRQGFENACWHRKACRDIENTRWVSFDIKFTRQGFENACWHREACRAIQHAFSKPSLVNLITKDANLVFYLSVYPLLNTLQTSDYDVIFDFCVISDVIQKVQRHHDLIKVTCREIGNVYEIMSHNLFSSKFDCEILKK